MTNPDKEIPQTIEEAIEKLISTLPINEKRKIANMNFIDLSDLHFSLGMGIRNEFHMWQNDLLIKSCEEFAGTDNLHVDNASMIIIEEVWKRLQTIKKLHVVKEEGHYERL